MCPIELTRGGCSRDLQGDILKDMVCKDVCVCVCVCVCVLELCRRIRKRLRDGRLMSASLAHGSPSVYICWAYLLPSTKTHL